MARISGPAGRTRWARSCCSSRAPACPTSTRAPSSSSTRWSTRTTAGRSTGRRGATCSPGSTRAGCRTSTPRGRRSCWSRRARCGCAATGPRCSPGYRPLPADGPAAAHAVAFQRSSSLVAVATRLPVGLAARGGWGDTVLALPDGAADWHDVVTDTAVDGAAPRLAELLAPLPGGAARPSGVREDRGVADFAVWAPQRDRVRVQLDGVTHAMTPRRGGLVAGRAWTRPRAPATPTCSTTTPRRCPTPAPAASPTACTARRSSTTTSAFFWTDRSWTGRQLPGSVLYELHVGTFTEAGTFDTAIETARPPGRAGRRPRRGAAGQRRRRPPQLGLRRRRLVRRHRELRRPGRVQAVRRRLPPARHGRGARRRLQPPRPVRRLPRPLRPLLRGQQHLGSHGQPRRLAAPSRCAATSSTTR